MTYREIVRRREKILDKMKSVSSLRRGTPNEQYVERIRRVARTLYVPSQNAGGKTVSRRIAHLEAESVRLDLPCSLNQEDQASIMQRNY